MERPLLEVEDFELIARANREDLPDLVGQVEPRVVLLSHREEDSRNWFAAQIHARHPKIKVVQPRPGIAVEV